MKWSRSYRGITRLGEQSLTKVWVSVQDYVGIACLKIWYPGRQFTPELKWLSSVSRAKKAGEQVMRRVAE